MNSAILLNKESLPNFEGEIRMHKWSRAWQPLRYFVSLLLTGISLLFAVSSYALDEKKAGPHGGTVLFVDAGVQDAQTLLSGVNPGVDVVRLRGDADGVQQIAEALKHYRNLDSIQIVSHGAPGRLALGSAMLDDAGLNRYRSALQAWGHALNAHGSILLYGCDVAQGSVGGRFVDRIGQYTGAAVAASTDTTGSPALGGNWSLEKRTAPIDVALAINEQVQARYGYLLALPAAGTQTIQASWANGTPTLTSFVPGFTFTNNTNGNLAGDGVNGGIYDSSNAVTGNTTTWTVNADGVNLGSFDLTAASFLNVAGSYSSTANYTLNFTGFKLGGGTVTASGTVNYTLGGTTLTWTTAPNFTTFTGITGFQVTFTAPTGANNSNITFTNYTIANPVAPAPAPTFTSITPTSGPTTGGTSVTITGTNFTGATSVTFGGVAAASFTVNSSTQITATTPAGAAGITNVAITTPGGTATGTGVYTYTAVAPTVTGISPSSGPTAGGTAVTITGTSFTGATAVTIGGANCTGVTVVSSTSITCTTPAGTAGAQNVAVTTAAGTGTGTGLYTYYAAPTVTSISPSSGPTAGGTAVTITGTNFTGATSVTIGGAAATSVVVVNATTITAITPAGVAGAANVAVTTPGGTGTGTGLYTYYAAPTVTGISPTSGSTAGGTSVTITGTNFTGATSVTIGGTAATSVTVVNATTITATTPAGSAGAANVAVTTPGGTGTG
ncbi:MAG TPA: IPT/TIG domain-containing protein, partial [Parasulfuritortus sp.]